MIKGVTLGFILFFISSCNLGFENTEEKIIKNFSQHEEKLDSVVRYTMKSYFDDPTFNSYNNLSIILINGSYHKGNTVADSVIANILLETDVNGIVLQKHFKCVEKYKFDVIKFKLKDGSEYQCYYVYDFCPENRRLVDKPNFKSIPLNGNWFLQIEK